jgi:hypothetical protein
MAVLTSQKGHQGACHRAGILPVDITLKDIQGRTLRLAVSPESIAWRMLGFGAGNVRLMTTKSRYRSITDWPTLRNQIRTGYLLIE